MNGTITINISDDHVGYESEEFDFQQVLFWLETLKHMMLSGVITKESE